MSDLNIEELVRLESINVDLAWLTTLTDKLAGKWNGDEPGELEELAHLCTEIKELSEKLLEATTELNKE